MLDCEHELWDRYAELCDRHAAILRKNPDSSEAYEVHLDAYNTLQEILNPKGYDRRLPPEAEQVLEFIRNNPMCTAQEILLETGLVVEDMRSVMTIINDKLGMDAVAGIVRFWVKRDQQPLGEEQLDEVVRSYMDRHGRIVVDDCAYHLGVTAPALRRSLVRIGYPRIYRSNRAGTTTIHYYPHGTTKEMIQCQK